LLGIGKHGSKISKNFSLRRKEFFAHIGLLLASQYN